MPPSFLLLPSVVTPLVWNQYPSLASLPYPAPSRHHFFSLLSVVTTLKPVFGTSILHYFTLPLLLIISSHFVVTTLKPVFGTSILHYFTLPLLLIISSHFVVTTLKPVFGTSILHYFTLPLLLIISSHFVVTTLKPVFRISIPHYLTLPSSSSFLLTVVCRHDTEVCLGNQYPSLSLSPYPAHHRHHFQSSHCCL